MFNTLTTYPYVGETKPEYLKAFFTPSNWFYVRNHAPVPVIAAEFHLLELESLDHRRSKLSLEDLNKNFETVDVVSVVQCAGNRGGERKEKSQFEKNIGVGLIGNAKWSGFRIRDVLEKSKTITSSDYSDCHLVMEGMDGYYTSIPLRLLHDDSLIATHMNGEALPRDHGYPMRVVIPGVIGARHVKWVKSLKISKQEARSPWNDYYYKSPDKDSLTQMSIQR